MVSGSFLVFLSALLLDPEHFIVLVLDRFLQHVIAHLCIQ